MHPLRCPRKLAATATILAALVAVPAASGATGGTVSGNVSGTPKAGKGETTVAVYDTSTGGVAAATRAGKSGKFSLKLPADGRYAVRTTVIAAGKPITVATAPVTVKKGQKRKDIKLTPKKLKTKKATKKLATRAYTQERGQVTPGVTAVSINDFTGGTGDWQYFAAGLGHLLQTDLSSDGGAAKCKLAQLATGRDRQAVLDELEFQKSKYVDPKTRVKRNLIISDLTVNGSVSNSSAGQATVTLTITDSRTGAVVDTVSGTISEGQAFEGAEQLAKALGERLCRRPASYTVALALNGTGDFATHSSSGNIASTLTALRSGGDAGAPASAWSGVSTMAWAGLSSSAKMSQCWMSDPVSPSFGWSAQIAATSDTTISLTWTVADGNASATFTINCRDDEGHVVSTAGMPGPAVMLMAPPTYTLPMAGGTVPVSTGFLASGYGWTNTGTMTVTPVWGTDPPKA